MFVILYNFLFSIFYYFDIGLISKLCREDRKHDCNFDEFNSIPGIFYHQANDLKDQPYLWKKENDKYVSLSWSQVKEQVESLATYLKDLGILEGDRVLILSENRPEWQITDLAIMSIGAISVPAYTTSTTNDYKYIIEHSGARCAIVSSHELMKKVLPAIEKNFTLSKM